MFGGQIRKANGAISYETGDQTIIYIGKVVVGVGSTFSPTRENNPSWGNTSQFSFSSMMGSGIRPPYHLTIFDNGSRNITAFTRYGINNLLLFVKPNDTRMRFGVIKTGASIGLLLEGWVAGGSFEVYVFCPRSITLSDYNSGYGMNIFDDDGRCIYTTNLHDLSIKYSGFISCPSFSFWPSQAYAMNLRHLGSHNNPNIRFSDAFYMEPLVVWHGSANRTGDEPWSTMVRCVLASVRNGEIRATLRYGIGWNGGLGPHYINGVDQQTVPSSGSVILSIDASRYTNAAPVVNHMTISDSGYQ